LVAPKASRAGKTRAISADPDDLANGGSIA